MSDERRPTVAITHVRERHRSIDRLVEAVHQVLQHLGGISHFVRAGHSVFIKPNQSVAASSDEGCTTDPRLIAALVRIAWQAGARRVQVGESSAGFSSAIECMKATGLAAAAISEGAELVDLGSDATPNAMTLVPGGRVVQEVPIPVPLLQADVIINVPKAKNHYLDIISGALMNWIGVVNQRWRHEHHDDRMIGRYIDVAMAVRPTLCVVDAMVIGEGDGPIATLPRWCGCLLASTDPVAVDVVIARLFGRDWRRLAFAKEADERGLGGRHPIDFRGVPLERVAITTWSGHEGFQYLPVNLLIGAGVTLSGTVGHVKSILDRLLRTGELSHAVQMRGTPTIMLGDIDDPLFEQHLEEGPYVVVDDAAKREYKNHPQVQFVPGHPVLWQDAPRLLHALGIDCAAGGVDGDGTTELQQSSAISRPERGPVIGRPFAAASLAALGFGLLRGLWRHAGRNGDDHPLEK